MKLSLLPLTLAALSTCAAAVETATIKVESHTTVVESSDAEEARWLASEAIWGTASFLVPSGDEESSSALETAILSFATTDTGRVYLYLMGNSMDGSQLAITTSEASLKPTSNFAEGACGASGTLDAEDPRCAKMTLTGTLRACPISKEDFDGACKAGWQALVDAHPIMAKWPDNHHFTVHELTLDDIWMIANFGGGSNIKPTDFQAAEPNHHPAEEFADSASTRVEEEEQVTPARTPVPDSSKKVVHARWIVGHSLWATISTTSTRLEGAAWGNIRSIVDGSSLVDSTGKPVFYLPTPDPTNIDVEANPSIAITLSEASLAQTLSNDESQAICRGRDPEDPLCARVVLYGTAVPIKCEKYLASVEASFGSRHPYAPWLAQGGAHTGGQYYTIKLDRVSILDYYGGATPVDVEEYLNWSAPEVLHTMLRGHD